MEVPIDTSGRIRWIDLTVPSAASLPSSDSAAATTPAIKRNAAACHVIAGDPNAYLFWRIHENLPNILEVVELFACNEYPEAGLRFIFYEALHPFAFLCKNECGGGDAYLLYALTVSGTAYLLNLKLPFKFVSGSTFPRSELTEFSVQTSALGGKVIAVAATFGCLLIGRQDGSIGCYQFGAVDPSKPGFTYELRDDAGLSRLWSLMSRGKATGAVQDMATSEVYGRKLLFVLHSDGIMRVWDFVNHARVLSHDMSSSELTGTSPSRLWVGSANYDANTITLAILHVSDIEMLAVYNFGFTVGDKNIFSPDPLMKTILLDKGRFIDMKISSDKFWILKEDGSLFYELSDYCYKMEHTSCYGLQEDFVSDQLFQSSEHALNVLLWTNSSLFSSMKDQIAPFVSSIFLRRLLQPGIYQSTALRAMLLDQKYLSDYEFQSLSADGLRKEILTIVNAEVSANLSVTVYHWKDFCARYFRYWCQFSMPYGLFIDASNNTVGLIRKNSFSLFRSLEGIEKLIYGSSDEFHDMKSYGLTFPTGNVASELLYEVLRCVSHINHQIGRAASAVFYESLLVPSISSEDVIFHILNILENGNSPLASFLSKQDGVDITWEKMQASHRSLRKFSVDMLVSLHTLHSKVSNWAGVLNVIEKYLENLKPHRSSQNSEVEGNCSINSLLLVHATSQVARLMFETAFDVLLFLGYLINTSGQVSIMQADVTRVQVKLVPMAHEILTQWLVLHFVCTTPTSPSAMDDFSSRLSSLHIGSKAVKRPWDGKLGSFGITLSFLLNFPGCFEGDHHFLKSFPSSDMLIHSVWKFNSLVVWGVASEESSITTFPTIELASLLLRHGQYEAAENLFLIIDDYSSKRKLSSSSWHADSDWPKCLHLLGFCLIMRAHIEVNGVLKEQKINEAVRCFFRAASVPNVSQSLQHLSLETGFLTSGESASPVLWKFHYYQWAMQIFDQYGMSEGASPFAFAALEQVDEILVLHDHMDHDFLPEPISTIHGRLWANIFKFALDLKNYRDAYCAIISNPDEDSKYICLRRFITVICEHGAIKVLCDGTLPFVGLIEKVEQELFWKAERSDIFARPNLYKLLYSFEAYRHSWRKAASYIYRYSIRLRNELNADDTRKVSTALKERLEGLSAAINALKLVSHASAWIDLKYEDCFSTDQGIPYKRPRNVLAEKSALCVDVQFERLHYNVDLEMLEKEYVLTSAHYLLSHFNFKFSGDQKAPNLVNLLIKENHYDMAFTVIFEFWKGSALNRELEHAFIALSEKCFSGKMVPSPLGSSGEVKNFLLPSPEDVAHTDSRINSSSVLNQMNGNAHWESLEVYLEKYRKLHPRLPVVVAETLLYGDPQIELPLWLVNMFKAGRKAWGMTGPQPDPATLFRLYIDYGRHVEATNLLLEYLESFTTLRPADAINRKKMSAIWFPYTAIERLWCQLEEMRSSGQIVEQCDRLKRLIQGALLNHLKQVNMDSEDAIASAAGQVTLS